METKRTIENLSLDGWVLCLDFVNTVNDRTETDPHDYLQNYDHWCDMQSCGSIHKARKYYYRQKKQEKE